MNSNQRGTTTAKNEQHKPTTAKPTQQTQAQQKNQPLSGQKDKQKH